MSKKRLIQRLILGAVSMLILSVTMTIIQQYEEVDFREERIERLNIHMNKITDENLKYLQGIKKDIKDLSISPALLERVALDLERRKLKSIAVVWVSDKDGKFVVGVPEEKFTKLNKVYDKYRDLIENKGYFVDRNDYLGKVAAKVNERSLRRAVFGNSDALDLSDNLSDIISQDHRSYYYFASWISSISVQLYDAEKNPIGKLHIAVNDSANSDMYRRHARESESFLMGYMFPFFNVTAILSLIFTWLLLPAFVYVDATSRGMRNVLAVVLLTGISFVIGFTIYMIVRPSRGGSLNCPACDKELDGTHSFCPYCGHDLSGDFCPDCQYPIEKGWEFCPGCRGKLGHSAVEESSEE